MEDETIHGDMIKNKGILYAPDFLINAGGLINVYSEWNGYVREIAFAQTENIYNTVLNIYSKSEEDNINTQLAAIKLAEKRVHDTMLLQSKI